MANGEDWYHQRHIVAPAFMGDRLKVLILFVKLLLFWSLPFFDFFKSCSSGLSCFALACFAVLVFEWTSFEYMVGRCVL